MTQINWCFKKLNQTKNTKELGNDIIKNFKVIDHKLSKWSLKICHNKIKNFQEFLNEQFLNFKLAHILSEIVNILVDL